MNGSPSAIPGVLERLVDPWILIPNIDFFRGKRKNFFSFESKDMSELVNLMDSRVRFSHKRSDDIISSYFFYNGLFSDKVRLVYNSDSSRLRVWAWGFSADDNIALVRKYWANHTGVYSNLNLP